MYQRFRALCAILPLFAFVAGSTAQSNSDSRFGYQGHLRRGGEPVTGTADFIFSLWSDPASPQAQHRVGAGTILWNVDVADGLFSVQLDFGPNAFDGSPRWLEIEVRVPAGQGAYTTLSPRQPVTGAPFAVATRGLFVDPEGNVGVGTPSPSAPLTVEGLIETRTGMRLPDGSVLTSAALGGLPAIYRVADYGILPGQGDVSAALLGLLRTVHDAGGGTIAFDEGVYRVDSRLEIPNDNNGDFRLPPTQKPIRIVGAGPLFSGQGGAPNGGTIIELAFAGSPARLYTRGDGLLQLENLTLSSPAPNSTPLLMSTNTTLLVRGCTFYGSITAPNCIEDAIVLGGASNIIGNSANAPFQGYGTIIEGNYFSRVRRGVFLRSYGNGVVIRDNTWWRTSGGPEGDDNAVAIESLGYHWSEKNAGGVITGNLIECTYYKYAIKLTDTIQFAIIANNFYDAEHSTHMQAYYYLADSTRSNLIIDGFHSSIDPRPEIIDLSPGQVNTRLTSHGNAVSSLGASHLKMPYGYTAGLGTDPRPDVPLTIKTAGGLGQNNAIRIYGGASAGGQVIIESRADDAYPQGGQIQFGVWGPDNHGARLVGIDNTGAAGAAVHCNAKSAVVSVTGDLALAQPGKGLRIAEGANARMGTATLNGVTPVVVPTAAVTAVSRIFLTNNDPNGSAAVGSVRVLSRTPGASFTIVSDEPQDRSIVAWMIVEPN